MQRLVTAKKGLTLSPSVHLPKGTFVSFTHPQSRRSDTLSQRPLNEFYPFRYAEMRSIAGEETSATSSIYRSIAFRSVTASMIVQVGSLQAIWLKSS